MSKDIFGVTPEGLSKRIKFDKARADGLKKTFSELIEQVRYTAEDDGWHRIVIFSRNSSTFSGMSYVERSAVLYYLRKHPNIISKLSDKEKRGNSLDAMKPYLFKWVSPEEKEKLRTKANCFRHISHESMKEIGEKFSDEPTDFLMDIFSILELFLGKKNQGWTEISVYNVSAFSGLPCENARAALNAMLKMNLMVIGYLPCEDRKNRWKTSMHITLSEDDYKKAASGEGIDAIRILTDKDAMSEKFTFSVVNYFYNAVKKVQEENNAKRVETVAKYFTDTVHHVQTNSDESKKISKPAQIEIPLDLETENDEEKISEVTQIPEVKNENLPAPTYQPINIVMPEVPGLNQTLDDIKSCVVSFTNIAESMYKNETQKNELLNSIVQANEKQRKEYDDLYNQMIAMKKILNQKDRDKDKFVKAIQDALNMMMGKIISETDEFSKIPRHLMDEKKLQAHKAEVIQITVQTAEEIRRLASSN